MKNWVRVVLFCLFGNTIGFAQSQTLEVVPNFEKYNTGFYSEVIKFSSSFEELSFVGISCYHFDDNEIQIEYRIMQKGVWSTWKKFKSQHEMVAENRKAYEGDFILDEFSSVQLKIMTPINGQLHVRFFLGQNQKSRITDLQKSISCEIPEVCERTCWCPACDIDPTPQLTIPTHIIIHHSAGSNQVNSDYSSVVEYIWDLHVNTNGWDDIGYNWLIDPNGVVYEGRPDGYQGAHFSCINENTVGICLLGDFSLTTPTELCMTSLGNLIAYETKDHLIDVLGESYHETGDFILSNIAGHRDSSGSENACSTTACPGDSFYPLLDSIKVVVSNLDCYQDGISSTKQKEINQLVFYPNPFKDKVNIHGSVSTSKTVELVNANGGHLGFYSLTENLDLAHLQEGLYFVIYEGRVVQKLIKQN